MFQNYRTHIPVCSLTSAKVGNVIKYPKKNSAFYLLEI